MKTTLSAPRGKLYQNILEAIGGTPMVKLNRLAEHYHVKAEIYAKLEFFNPLSSVKDRIAIAMVEDAEEQGLIKPGSILVEPTSGNTGIGLAFVCAAKGYKLVLTMPESMSLERRKMLQILGAELVLTEAARGMRGAIEKAEEMVADNKNAILLQQFSNKANPEIHRHSTAVEILADTGGMLDVFVAGVGTGGTITGTVSALKQSVPNLHAVAVEPEDSPVLAGGNPGPHKIQGIGAGFVPDNLDMQMVDEVFAVSNAQSFETARLAAKLDGLAVGISSGASLYAALRIGARDDMAGKRIAVIVASPAERYITTDLFAD
jgi:cysteine synthase A